MKSTLETAYDDFLTMAKPFAQRILPSPVLSSDEADVRTKFSTLARDLLAVDHEGWSTENLFRLRKTFEIAIHLGKNCENQWILLYAIFEALSDTRRCRTFSEVDAWKRVLESAVFFLNSTSDRHMPIAASREHLVALALTDLEAKGYTYKIYGYGPRLTIRSVRRLCSSIERRISRAGGVHVANALLALMRRLGRLEDDSFLHARTPTMVGLERRRVGTPWHYIYNLSLKHFDTPPRTIDPTAILEIMEERANNLAAALNVEPHSSYENMSITRAGVEWIIRETTVYDELFGMPQWQPKASAILISMWISSLAETECEFPVLTKAKWESIAKSLIARSRPDSIEPIAASDLQSPMVSISDAEAALMVLCQPTQNVNAGYFTPFDTGSRTSSWWPGIRSARLGCFVQPTAIASRAFCERLYSLMRDGHDANVENKVGKALELTVVKLMQSFELTPTVINGQYSGDKKGEVREIDLVLETEDRIFLVECTKKPLTTAARGGSTIAALRDLEGSLLKFVQQFARHEAALRSRGFIVFDSGETVELRGRKIEKLGINLFDHGSLQNRDFTISLIELLTGARLTATLPIATSLVDAINRRLDRISQSFEQIADSQSETRQRVLHCFAMSTWWLSIDQLTYVIMKGHGDLWQGLRDIRHLTARSGDLIYEIKRSLNLNEVGRALLEVAQLMDTRAMV